MHRPSFVLSMSLSLSLLAAGCGDRDSPQQPSSLPTDTTNPLFAESELPYGMPAFDRIENEHFVPAFERAMAEQIAEIEAIASNSDPATFENTIAAMEIAGQMLGRARAVFGALTSAHTNDTLKEIETLMAPKFSAHDDSILLNPDLFVRLDALHQARDALGLDAESLRLLERYHTDFVRAGAELSEEQKVRLREINTERAELTTAFAQNVLNEVNDSAVVVSSRDELAGLSASQIETAAAEAASRGLDGQYVLTLRNTTQQPLLTSLQNRDLRRRIQETSVARGSRGNAYENRDIITRILTLRAERAALLGYENHAAYILEDRTAGTIVAVNDMLGSLGPRAVANARREAADLQALIDETEAEPFKLASWDWLYYTEQLRKRRYNFDAAELKSYFELDRVLKDGVFFFAERLYGVTFVARPDLPVYQYGRARVRGFP